MIGVLSLVLLAGVVVEGRSVLLFHTTTPWSSSAPPRIHVCGRDYDRGGVVPASAARDANGVDVPLQQLADGPLWQPVYGHPADPQLYRGEPCAMVLYMREGNGYRSFELVGGP
jgi:hypothetical protein